MGRQLCRHLIPRGRGKPVAVASRKEHYRANASSHPAGRDGGGGPGDQHRNRRPDSRLEQWQQCQQCQQCQHRSALGGSKPSWATTAHRVGPANGSKKVGFRVYLRNRDAAGAAAYARAVSTKGDPLYGKFLTPAQFRSRFSPTDAAVTRVKSWLHSQGFAIGDGPGQQQVRRSHRHAREGGEGLRHLVRHLPLRRPDHARQHQRAEGAGLAVPGTGRDRSRRVRQPGAHRRIGSGRLPQRPAVLAILGREDDREHRDAGRHEADRPVHGRTTRPAPSPPLRHGIRSVRVRRGAAPGRVRTDECDPGRQRRRPV